MLQNYLKKNNSWVLSVVAGLAAFGTYSCMYAYRKSFAAGTYSGMHLWGLDYKVVLVIAQVFGYMLSKFVGIRVVSGINLKYRLIAIISFMAWAWLALLGFALVPPPYNVVFLFINGLPLGMIWGLVFSFLEGRKSTELMAAIMASSLVFASGFVKSVGRTLLQDFHMNEFWMPFFTGLLFALPMCLFLYLLSQLPEPNEEDIKLRTKRVAMTNKERHEVVRNYWPGLVCIVSAYLLLTIVRDLRDNFEVEIWSSLGFAKQPSIFTQIDFPVALFILAILASLILVKNNMKAFILLHHILLIGLSIAGIAAILFLNSLISPVVFMSLAALGLYLAYVPCNSIFFERMISAFKINGNVGFVMYIADATGYLGSVGILLYKQFTAAHISWLQFFIYGLLTIWITGSLFVLLSLRYFTKKREKYNSLNIISTI